MSIYTDDTAKKSMFFDGTTDISKYVVPDSFKKTDYLCTGQLNFGEVNSTKIQFKTYGNLDLTGHIITVKYGTDMENALVGTYKVIYTSTKSNSTVVTITAYDAIKAFDKDVSDWYAAQSWPMKLKDLRKSLCQYAGVDEAETELINDEIMILETVNPSSFNGMEMLFYIGQINGVFAHAADDYSVEWVSLGTDTIEIPKSVTYGPTAFEAKSYDTAPIGGLVIRQQDGDVGVSIGITNKYVVQGNILVYGYSTDELTLVADRLYNKIKAVRYIPCSLKVKYLPDIKMGSRCSYDGNVFYVLQRSTTGLMFDKLTAGGNEYLKTDSSIESQIEQLRGKSNILERSIEESKSTISDIEKGLKNEITQTASEFDAKLQNLQSEMDGEVAVVNGTGRPALENFPAYNWTSGPKIGDTLVKGLCFTYSDAVYKKHQRTLFFDEDTATTYRFIQKNGTWVWEPLGNTEFSILQKQITNLNLTAQGITADVESLSTLITNDYITEVDARTLASVTADGIMADVSKTYARDDVVQKMQLIIKATAEEMDLKVEKDKLIAEINARAGNVKIKADAIDLTGLVTIKSLETSGETKINADNITTGTINALTLMGCTLAGGSISIGGNNIVMNEAGLWVIGKGDAQHPNFRVDNDGNVTAQSGQIGNWSIGSGAIANNGTVLGSDGTLVLAGDNNAIQLGSNAKLIPTALFVNQGGYNGSVPWWGVFKAAAQAVTSDERIKQDVEVISDGAYERLFNALQTYTYRFKAGSGFKTDKIHMGFIAQRIKENLEAAGLPGLAVFDDDNPELLGIDKQELIALCVWQIQKLKKRVSELENNIGGAA